MTTNPVYSFKVSVNLLQQRPNCEQLVDVESTWIEMKFSQKEMRPDRRSSAAVERRMTLYRRRSSLQQEQSPNTVSTTSNDQYLMDKDLKKLPENTDEAHQSTAKASGFTELVDFLCANFTLQKKNNRDELADGRSLDFPTYNNKNCPDS